MRFASKMPRRGGVILLTVLAVSPIGCERGQTPDEVKYLGNEAAVQQHMKTVEAEERANRGENAGRYRALNAAFAQDVSDVAGVDQREPPESSRNSRR